MKKGTYIFIIAFFLIPRFSFAVSDGEIFDMKQKCASYTEIIKNEIFEFNLYLKENPRIKSFVTLGETFYSPVLNSCLYTEIEISRSIGEKDCDGTSQEVCDAVYNTINSDTHRIRDYLNNEKIIFTVSTKPATFNDDIEPKISEFYDRVNYYKGNEQKIITKPIVSQPIKDTKKVKQEEVKATKSFEEQLKVSTDKVEPLSEKNETNNTAQANVVKPLSVNSEEKINKNGISYFFNIAKQVGKTFFNYFFTTF